MKNNSVALTFMLILSTPLLAIGGNYKTTSDSMRTTDESSMSSGMSKGSMMKQSTKDSMSARKNRMDQQRMEDTSDGSMKMNKGSKMNSGDSMKTGY